MLGLQKSLELSITDCRGGLKEEYGFTTELNLDYVTQASGKNKVIRGAVHKVHFY